jgi:hypothetical protein
MASSNLNDAATSGNLLDCQIWKNIVASGVGIGGFPLIGLYVVAQTGNIYAGLYYPIIVASITFVVGSLLLKETRHVLIWDETGSEP